MCWLQPGSNNPLHYFIDYKVWDEITYPSPNFNGCTVDVWKWIINFMFRFAPCDYPYWGFVLVTRVPRVNFDIRKDALSFDFAKSRTREFGCWMLTSILNSTAVLLGRLPNLKGPSYFVDKSTYDQALTTQRPDCPGALEIECEKQDFLSQVARKATWKFPSFVIFFIIARLGVLPKQLTFRIWPHEFNGQVTRQATIFWTHC